MITLQGPDKPYALVPSFTLVHTIESAYGSLYLLAESLLNKSLPVSRMIEILKLVFRHAGCEAEEKAMEDFLIQQPCTEMLITFLLDMLEPVERSSGETP